MKRLTIMKSVLAALVTTVAAGELGAAVTQVAKLELSADQELVVAEGDRYEIMMLSASSHHTLTKKGPGVLYVGKVMSSFAHVAVEEGLVEFSPFPAVPSVAQNAALHLDASTADKLVTEEAEGKTYVTQWNDENGGANYAVPAKDTARPTLVTLSNGVNAVDFGPYVAGNLQSGMLLHEKIAATRDLFSVQMHIEGLDIKELQAEPPQIFGNVDPGAFLPYGQSYKYEPWPYFFHETSEYTVQLRPSPTYGVFVNGVHIPSWGTDDASLKVVNWHVADPAPDGTEFADVDRLNANRYVSSGGKRLCEAMIFTSSLSDEARSVINAYLQVKWLGYEAPSAKVISVGEGGLAKVWNGSDWDYVVYKKPNVYMAEMTLTEDAALEVDEGVTNEIYILKGGPYTLTKTGPGILKIGLIASDDVRVIAEEGEIVFGRPDVPPIVNEALRFDAADLLTMTTESGDGTNYVTRWNDASGSDVYATAGTVKPYLRTDYCNGLPVLDFGTIKTASVPDGYGAWMDLSTMVTDVRETFSVMCHTEDTVPATGGGIGFLGCSENYYTWMTVDNWTGHYPTYCNYSHQRYTGQIWDGIYLNGEKQVYNDYVKGSFGIYNTRVAEPAEDYSDYAMFNAFARHLTTCGGQLIGEQVVFTRALTDEERQLVYNYLYVKWFAPRRFAANQLVLGKDATLVVTDDGSVELPEVVSGGNVRVVNGAFVLNPLRAATTSLHLDAAATDTMEQADGRIARWNDAAGGAHYAEQMTVAQRPELVSLPSGHEVVDFGELKSYATDGYGCWMKLDMQITGIREAILVQQMREEAYTGTVCAPLAIGGNVDNNLFKSFKNKANFHQYILNGYQSCTSQAWPSDSSGVYVNGVKGADQWGQVSGNLEIIDCQIKDFAADEQDYAFADYLASVVQRVFGGVRVGEVILFPEQLSAADRVLYTELLKAKWLGGEGYGYGHADFGRIEIVPGASFSVPYGAVEVEDLVLGGWFDAKKVRASRIEPTVAETSVSGVLDLTGGGTVVIRKSVFGEHEEGVVRLVGASSVIGTTAGWTVSSDYDVRVRLVIKDDGLYAKFSNRGIILLLR